MCREEGHVKKSDKILVATSEGNRPHGRPRRRWEDNQNGLKGIGWKYDDWIHLIQVTEQRQAFVNKVMNLRVQ
jgi:hypothetical protein